MPDQIAYELAPLVTRLRARYPGVRIVWAKLARTDNGLLQNIRYQAPLALLKRYRLVTKRTQAALERGCVNALGDAVLLFKRLDVESCPGCWDILWLTPTAPREQPRMSLRDAQRELERIARKSA